MISVEDKEVFEQYYQVGYDFNTSSLNEQEIIAIKKLAKQQRVDYALAPIGEQIFEFILTQHPELQFELVELETEKIDGMLYIPLTGEEKAHIIINGKKPLINQIFAAAHECYHYIEDYEQIKKKPYICCLSALKDVNEKRASRFAAEILLPEEALKNEIRLFKLKMGCASKKTLEFEEYASICMVLTLKYQMPLKAVIYRLHEEGYIKDIKVFIENYDVIKRVLLEIEIVKEPVNHLYNTNNDLIDGNGLLYQQMEKAYLSGLASRDEIIKDAEYLKLNTDIVNTFFEEIDDTDSEDEDIELTKAALERWGGL